MWHRAARHGGYTWKQFEDLDGEDQAEVVADYLTDQQIKAVEIQNRD